MTTATTTARRVDTSVARAGFGSTLASEWTKFTSVRSTYIMIGLTVLLSLGMTVLVTTVIGATWSDWQPSDQASFDPILTSLSGAIFSGIILSVLGVTAVSSEYSSGMIRTTLTATPRRGRVLAAKALIIGAIALVVGTITTIGMFLVGQAILGSSGIPTASLGDEEALRTLFGIGIGSPVFPLIGAALAFLLRNTAGAITTVIALIFAPSIFGAVLTSWWQENIIRFLPGPATDNLARLNESGSALYMAPGLAAIVAVAWLVLFLGAAYALLTKRDA
ncbi:MAG: ABC transporter permease [Dehalococcoidia bacterium]